MPHATIKNGSKILEKVTGFEWDSGNRNKNLARHQVTTQECEEVFFNQNRKTQIDALHSKNEERYILIGNTKRSRLLYIIFTVRKEKVRIISARDINKKERKLYEEKTENSKI